MKKETLKTSDFQDTIDQVINHPVVQITFVTIVIVVLLFIAGKLSTVLKTVTMEFKQFGAAMRATVPPATISI